MARAYRRTLAALVVLRLAVAPVLAAQGGADYDVMPEHSVVSFTIVKWMVLRETGGFTRFHGTIHYDPVAPSGSSVTFEIDAASIDTGIERRDAVLRSDDFFDVSRYPALGFRSVDVRSEGAHALQVTGDLTIHGVTRRMTIPVSVLGVNRVDGVGDIAGFETRFAIDRTSFGVNGTRWSGGRLSLGAEVVIELRLAAQARSITD